MQKTISIFTDGSSLGNPGRGGYGAVLIFHDKKTVQEIGGAEKNTTNNRMEMRAVIEALKQAPADSSIKVYSDSAYVLQGITTWLSGWIRRNWRTSTNTPVLNEDLWKELASISAEHSVEWIKVKGHAGSAGNERCDEIARTCAAGEKVDFFSGSLSDYESMYGNADTLHDVNPVGSSKKKSGTAYSYVSMVDGVIKTHSTWDDCKKRVHGAQGARYQKTFSKQEESDLIGRWSLESLL